ncbi:LPS O-antigen chain length determinant protein WzzB [Aeromonas cavernicola]|uniref:O-antigen chain length regulator n=1 Tax=Aeromonas cavernicola TaxID=1006623 RepID=A0A2H9U7Y3_9GAMM|nr:Wzz/FepE/Etk N-terminal domain-containing protein [Aeromonas cavernicola]PJG60157.1 O-antigen chain length regulator [Aeromonas cavernicola]
MNDKVPSIPPQLMHTVSSDEIDLRELVLVLWRHKTFILLVTILFTAIGISYALTARQVWVSQAVITSPSIEQLNTLKLDIDKLSSTIPLELMNQIDLSEFSKAELYKSFIYTFNSIDNKRQFFEERGIIAEELSKKDDGDEKHKKALVNRLSEGVIAKLADKTSNDMTLSFSADTAVLAKQRLQDYIAFTQKKQTLDKYSALNYIIKNRVDTLTIKYDNLKTDTLKTLQDNINRIQYSLRISQAAGVEKPLERTYSGSELFNIDLGSKALAEKLKVFEEIKNPELLDPKLGQIRLRLDSLKSLKLTPVPFYSFQMLGSPEEPLTRDKPKRSLIVVLATLLGGMLAVAIVLVRHAFRKPAAQQ